MRIITIRLKDTLTDFLVKAKSRIIVTTLKSKIDKIDIIHLKSIMLRFSTS